MMDQTTPTEQSQYVLLRADALRLLIPQEEIGAIGHLDSLPEPSGMPGLLAVPGEDSTCYVVLSEDFRLLEHCPDDRFVTTLIHMEDGMDTNWCWSEARVLLDFEPQVHEVPEVLLTEGSPLRRYTIMDEQPVFVCSVETLQQLALGAQ